MISDEYLCGFSLININVDQEIFYESIDKNLDFNKVAHAQWLLFFAQLTFMILLLLGLMTPGSPWVLIAFLTALLAACILTPAFARIKLKNRWFSHESH